MQPKRVLAVDDNIVNLRLLTAIMERMGAEVATATDGQQAVDAVRSTAFDVVLMDLSMPVMDGYAATETIRALPVPWANLPIIAVTAHTDDHARARCQSVGMDDFIGKPIDFRALERAITRVLEARTSS